MLFFEFTSINHFKFTLFLVLGQKPVRLRVRRSSEGVGEAVLIDGDGLEHAIQVPVDTEGLGRGSDVPLVFYDGRKWKRQVPGEVSFNVHSSCDLKS